MNGLAHAWDVTPQEARRIQEQGRHRVIREDDLPTIHTVAGIDVGFEDRNRITRAAVVVLEMRTLTLIERRLVRRPTRFPYVPGLLSFREAPAVLEALGELETQPDLLVCDGHGIAHPRRFGIACHLGVLTGRPSIGIAKRPYVGVHEEPGAEKGAWTPLTDGDEVIGAALRSRVGVKPIYVSVGHRIGLASAIRWATACLTRYKLPEPTRLADRLASDRGPLPDLARG